jgi:polysaccharide chain length determinant protein (PEP-CTERM system associated)
MDELQELKDVALHFARGIWKNRWIGIAIAWVILIGGILAVDRIQNRYEAETKVFIDTESVLRPLLAGLAIEPDFQATVLLISKQLLSRPNVERAIRLVDEDFEVSDAKQLETLIISFQNKINISADRANIYTISYADANRFKARRMVQTLLDIFVEDALGKTDTESDSAIDFLNSQIDKYDRLLQEAEKRREEFKRKNIGLMPQDGNNYYAELQATNNTIETNELLLAELENRHAQIQIQIRNFELEHSDKTVLLDSNFDARIEEQEKKLDELLLLYTEEHPDVINTQHILDTLRQRKSNEIIESKSDGSILDSPVYQELQIALSRTEVEISAVATRVYSAKQKRVGLKKLVDIVPQIEADLLRLDRDYDIHKKNYNQFVDRREKALIAEDVETGSDQVKFRIIEPPFVSSIPAYPNRPLFDFGVIVSALGIGYGIALLISMLKPVFYNQRDLMKYIGGSVLGAVSKYDSPNIVSKRRKSIAVFGVVNFIFFLSAGSLILLHWQGISILSQFPKGMLIIDQLKALVI